MDVLIVLACLFGGSSLGFHHMSKHFDTVKDPDLRIVTIHKRFRPAYHISAPMAWINDPAAFVHFKGNYHIFYQYHPYTGAWGHMHWGHVTSDNLVDWVQRPPALTPDDMYERNGCLAGSAVVYNDFLTVFYTGNALIHNKTRQSQNIAISVDGILFQKYLYNPVIQDSPYVLSGVGNFRNPKVWLHQETWYMIIGVMSNKVQGQLLLYTSSDMFHWQFNGTLASSYKGDMGYIWESPDLFEMDGQDVLILSVRGINTDGFRFRNLYQTGYIIGTFNYINNTLDEMEVSAATFNELDYGHDFYAAHTMLAHDGRRLLVAWLGMWESRFEELQDGWASMLTLVRELRLSNRGRLMMTPVAEMAELRKEVLEDAWYSPGEHFRAGSKSFELLVNTSTGANIVQLAFEWNGIEQYTVTYHSLLGYVSVDRGGVDGLRRADWAPVSDLVYWRIFFDYSSVEVFCGDGDVVFSSRVYPKRSITIRVNGDTQLHILQYKLRKSVSFPAQKISKKPSVNTKYTFT